MWTVYIVSCSDGTLYTGIARDVEERIELHNNGKGAKYTKTRRPVKLAYKEQCLNRSKALIREHQIKKLSRTEKQQLISN